LPYFISKGVADLLLASRVYEALFSPEKILEAVLFPWFE
jgi:hypothetical protein